MPLRDNLPLFMPPSKRSPAPALQEHDRLEVAVEDLAGEVKTLSQQVEVLTAAIDDLREELQFAIRNLPREPWVPVQPLVSMPRDPLADPFPVNRTRREDVPTTEPTATVTATPPPPIETKAPAENTATGLGELF